jgi:WhiB family redox-sensing transcriptional regulator
MWLMSERTRDHRLPDLAGYADTRPAWMKDGACRGQDPGVFVTDKIESIRRPKALCSTCGVRDECLDYAMADVELQGVWGMTSERDRARIRAQRAA